MGKTNTTKSKEIVRKPSKNKELREKVYALCDRLGFWNINNSAVAEKMGTSHQNVHRWKRQYVKVYGVPDVKRIGQELNVNAMSAMKELMKLAKDDSKHVRLKAIGLLIDAIPKYGYFLEQFGYKEKVAELHHVIEHATLEIVPPAWLHKKKKEEEEKVIDIDGR